MCYAVSNLGDSKQIRTWETTSLSSVFLTQPQKAKDLHIHIEVQQIDLLMALFQRDSKQLLPPLNESNFNVTNIL